MDMALKFKMLDSYTVLDLEWLKTHQGTLRIKNLHIEVKSKIILFNTEGWRWKKLMTY